MGQRTTDTLQVQSPQGGIGQGEVSSDQTDGTQKTEVPEPFQYQIWASTNLFKKKRAPLISPPGSGKTRMLLDAWGKEQKLPLLIFAGRNGTATWLSEIAKWYGEEWLERTYVATGMKLDVRKALWNSYYRDAIVIVTYQTAIYDKDIIPREWSTIICDEAQRWRNKKSAAFKQVVNRLRSEYFFPATGTAIRKGPQNMWTMLNRCNPNHFPSYWKFVETFCEIVEGYYGKEIIGPRNEKAFQDILSRYGVFVPKHVVDEQLPEKFVRPLEYAMSRSQQKYYKKLEDEVLLEIQESDQLLVNRNMMTRLLRLRQLMCMPKILDPSLDIGGGLELIIERLHNDRHTMIFVPFKAAIPYVKAALEEEFKDISVYVLHGGLPVETVGEITKAFDDDPNSVLLCTIQFAESFSINTAETAYFLGTTWEPDVMEQAEDRIRRASTTHDTVAIYHMNCKGTVDEVVRFVRDGYSSNARISLGSLVYKIKERRNQA